MKQLFELARMGRVAALTTIAGAVLLTGCASVPEAPPVIATPPSFQSLMNAGEAAQRQNQAAQAMALYEQAAKMDPANKQPWLHMAQSYFDSRSYGQAITASQEVLHRDNTDVTAKSLMAASGLRVSADALDQLRQANAVGGSTRTEAQALARIMREAVGEAVFPRPALPPAVETPPAKPAPRPRPKPVVPVVPATPPAATPAPATPANAAPAVVAPAAPKPAAASPAPAAAAKPSSPFDVLKKN